LITLGAFIFAFIKFTNPAIATYFSAVAPTLVAYQGELVGKGFIKGEAEPIAPLVEGSGDEYNLGIVLAFPSVEKAKGWKESEDYQKIVALRLDNSTGPLVICKSLQ
jgi:uncharacterized protein (DUF1330 family)